MKFSLATISAVLLASCVTLTKADEYADAIKQWCQGLTVPYPDENAVFVAGTEAKVTVNRTPDQHTKTVTGLDLYSVSPTGQAQYVKNVWHGSYELNQQASIPDTIPQNSSAGLYYYRVWVTNQINGQHGPDCLETSHTFKVTTGLHTNEDGSTQYSQALNNAAYYHPDHFKGCFGLEVKSPKEGKVYTEGEHAAIIAERDSSSQTGTLKKVLLYKVKDTEEDELIDTVWTGEESFTDILTIKDQVILPQGKLDESANYYYGLVVTSKKSDDDCTFASKNFKIKKSS
ncbi:hypothetical protein CLU79DRAFT_706960 [Phycomyces nitens]|nr:hypothetical protein CLU79DRAFT_706960 [Phycomyces nitens]